MVRKNYRSLSLEHHPDKGGSHEKSVELNNAYTKVQEILPASCQSFHENEDLFETLNITCENYDGPKAYVKREVKIEVPNCEFNPDCTYSENYIFFDVETNQESGTHEVTLAVAQYFNSSEIFSFPSADKFCKWLITKEHKNYTAVAHFGGKFDAYIVLSYCVRNGIKPYTIYKGTKLLLLEIPSIKLKIIDSYNFVQAPLKAFPKAFSLTELKKGYFPFLFDTMSNMFYVGPIPDKKYYCYDSMSVEDRKAFMAWHQERVDENYMFDLEEERYNYCVSDVDILKRGMTELR